MREEIEGIGEMIAGDTRGEERQIMKHKRTIGYRREDILKKVMKEEILSGTITITELDDKIVTEENPK